MSHFGVYWPFFSNTVEPWPVDGWRIGSGSRLADAERGDVLWLFTSGTKCRKRLRREGIPTDGIENHLAYLAQILEVDQIVPDEVDELRFLIKGKPGDCRAVKPPLLIDDLIRAERSEAKANIGQVRQAAWKLADYTVDLLKDRLKQAGYSNFF